jgi:hypothetical protein
VNATPFIKHSEPLFYACKHKYRTKTNKNQQSRPQGPAFELEKYLKKLVFLFVFFWKLLPLPNLLSFPNLEKTFS